MASHGVSQISLPHTVGGAPLGATSTLADGVTDDVALRDVDDVGEYDAPTLRDGVGDGDDDLLGTPLQKPNSG